MKHEDKSCVNMYSLVLTRSLLLLGFNNYIKHKSISTYFSAELCHVRESVFAETMWHAKEGHRVLAVIKPLAFINTPFVTQQLRVS